MSPAFPLSVFAAAETDVEEAVRWYDGVGPGIGDAFLLDLDELLTHIGQHPEMFQSIKGPVRRAVMRGFPYSVLYRVLAGGIEIIGVLHTHGDPARAAARTRVRRL